VNLTVPEVNISVSQDGETLMAEASGASFRWLQCNENYKIINNAVDQSFTPTTSGEYAVEVSQHSCVDTSGCFFVNITGILYNTLGDGLELYPNPATVNITINLPEMYKKIDVELTNLLGQSILKECFFEKKRLSLSLHEPIGFYFLTIRNNLNERTVMKIILE
jgi:hypothetical protein